MSFPSFTRQTEWQLVYSTVTAQWLSWDNNNVYIAKDEQTILLFPLIFVETAPR